MCSPKGEVIEILGAGFSEQKDGSNVSLRYTVDDFDSSVFLQRYNMPLYEGLYRFRNDRLVSFELGFPYP